MSWASGLVDRQRGHVDLLLHAVDAEQQRTGAGQHDGVAVADRLLGRRQQDVVGGGLQALLVQHLGHGVGVRADALGLPVDGEDHRLLGDEEGQRPAHQSEQDQGEEAEAERAAHGTSRGHGTRAGGTDGPRGRHARRVPSSTPADGHDTITNTVRGATVRDE
jgi:hypothetical protein